MNTVGLVSTIIQGHKWLQIWHEGTANPPHLSGNAILTFKRFKEAYDGKNINKLSHTLSNSYKGDLFGVSSKEEYLDIQRQVFKKLPWGVHPCLTINVYSVIEDTSTIFSAIIDTHSLATILGVPTFAYDSAPMRVKVQPENGLWMIQEMFVERRLI